MTQREGAGPSQRQSWASKLHLLLYLFNSDFQLFSSRGTHKLKFCNTPKNIFLDDVTKREILIHSYRTSIFLLAVINF